MFILYVKKTMLKIHGCCRGINAVSSTDGYPNQQVFVVKSKVGKTVYENIFHFIISVQNAFYNFMISWTLLALVQR